MLIRYISSEQRPLETIGVRAPSKSNSEIDSMSHYKESIELQYPMQITRYYVLKSMSCYSLHSISLWIGVYSLTRWKLSTFQDYVYYPWVINPPIVCITNYANNKIPCA